MQRTVVRVEMEDGITVAAARVPGGWLIALPAGSIAGSADEMEALASAERAIADWKADAPDPVGGHDIVGIESLLPRQRVSGQRATNIAAATVAPMTGAAALIAAFGHVFTTPPFM